MYKKKTNEINYKTKDCIIIFNKNLLIYVLLFDYKSNNSLFLSDIL